MDLCFRPKEEDTITDLIGGDNKSGGGILFIAYASNEVFSWVGGTFGSSQAMSCSESIFKMLYDASRETIVVLTKAMMLVQHRVSPAGVLSHREEAKLSGKKPTAVTWAGPGILVTCTGDGGLRMWDLETSNHYVLGAGVINKVAFSPTQKLLVASSPQGIVHMWRHRDSSGSESSLEDWVEMPPVDLSGGSQSSLVDVCCGGARALIAVRTEDTVSVLREHTMSSSFGAEVCAVQVSSTRLVVEGPRCLSREVDTDFTIKGVSVSGATLAIWSGSAISVYELVKDKKSVRQIATFPCSTCCVVVVDAETICTTEKKQIICRSLNGIDKQRITLNDAEGDVTSLDINGHFLAVGTDTGFIRVWDLSKRIPESLAPGHSLANDLDSIDSVRVSSDGTQVTVIGSVAGNTDSSIWVWNAESNLLQTFDFGIHRSYPVAHAWDSAEPRLFACEVQRMSGNGSDNAAEASAAAAPNEIFTLFATADDGVYVQQRAPLAFSEGGLMALQVPHLYVTQRPGSAASGFGRASAARVLPDFAGLEGADEGTRSAMMSFSYNLTVGNMDEAFKAVRPIKNKKVWENLARMCVNTRRMDVASVCMGNMGNAAGARAIRDTENEPEIEARVAMLAIQLGMHDEAVALYTECERWDLLNALYQGRGEWDKAVACATEHDRNHLRATHYAHAKFLEAAGRTREAITAYELSDTHKFEVPRMLGDDQEALETYVKTSNNEDLLKWWAQYLESSHDMQNALEYYSAASDTLSQVRVHCFCDDLRQARALVESTGDKAAAYHLARQFENQDAVDEAIKFFSMSGCYNNAIRLAKDHGLKQDLMGLALQSTKADMVEAAQFYEQDRKLIEKAVTLYHKGGRVGRALELCFEHKLYGPLADISADLDNDSDPELLSKAATFFLEARQFDRAVSLLIAAGQYDEALDLCEQQAVAITEDMAEKMTPDKGGDDAVRTALLERIADCCSAQGSHQLATKKYTQAKNMVKAMKALLRVGDTERVIFFATKCRQKEIYVIAANYLQGLDWRHNQDIMQSIIQFYTKGKALDSLSSFYEACAQVEIDDYQNYEKAMGALNEAMKYLSRAKMKDFATQEARVGVLQNRISLTQKFVDIRSLAESDVRPTLDSLSFS